MRLFLLPLSQLKLYDMKYVKILFAIALVFTMCSAFSLKKGNSKPVYALEFRLHLLIRLSISQISRYWIVQRSVKTVSWHIASCIAIS